MPHFFRDINVRRRALQREQSINAGYIAVLTYITISLGILTINCKKLATESTQADDEGAALKFSLLAYISGAFIGLGIIGLAAASALIGCTVYAQNELEEQEQTIILNL